MELLKKALSKLINFGENLEGALKDHKVNLIEGVTLSANLGTAIFFSIQNRKELISELNDLSEDDVRELKNYIKEEFDLDNDRVELIVESTIDLLHMIIGYIEVIKKS